MVSLKISESIIDQNILNKSPSFYLVSFRSGYEACLRRRRTQTHISSVEVLFTVFIGLRFTCFSSFDPALLLSAISSLGGRRVRSRGWNSFWFMRNWQYNQCAVCNRWSGAELKWLGRINVAIMTTIVGRGWSNYITCSRWKLKSTIWKFVCFILKQED